MSTTRVAVVTGASRGIGEAVALRLADDGFDVAVNDIPAMAESLEALVEKIRQKGRRSLAVTGDVSNENDVKTVVDKVVETLGGLDVMVANAGTCLLKPVVETSIEEYDRVMSVNVKGVFLCFKYAALQMIKQGRGGRIIGACSLAGKMGVTNLSVYTASKFAVRGLTQTCALEWAKHGITVNSYAPGMIRTPLMMEFSEVASEKNLTTGDTLGIGNIPIAEPSVIGELVSYLVKPESHFVSGEWRNLAEVAIEIG
ncbi:Hydroxynaphthalene reductase arp2 [Sparassis crispa]|uniref:Hydroxynaphthalene reductase arp2 n=1 Tax=Sparassis crispa TaxID=139825 RepID=A0A401GZL4_9APHY|nr:Hydroxynaphthalene reductase arp2 [Sparassis crispa]GBE87615.1 Hydroxynaphthalene reductase arp2 [Sparassis crispa]